MLHGKSTLREQRKGRHSCVRRVPARLLRIITVSWLYSGLCVGEREFACCKAECLQEQLRKFWTVC
jgi:hypothetical protein